MDRANYSHDMAVLQDINISLDLFFPTFRFRINLCQFMALCHDAGRFFRHDRNHKWHSAELVEGCEEILKNKNPRQLNQERLRLSVPEELHRE